MTTPIWRSLYYLLILFVNDVRTASCFKLPSVVARSTSAGHAVSFSLSSVRSALGVSIGDHDGDNDSSSTSSSSNSRSRGSMMQPTTTPSVLCVGEALWDSLPSGMYLGGAPTNVAVHLASLFRRSLGGKNLEHEHEHDEQVVEHTVAIATTLGNDRLGRESVRRLAQFNVRTDYIQFHSTWETGVAMTTIDTNGDATYEFITPAAFDGLLLDDALMKLLSPDDENDVQGASNNNNLVYIMGTMAARLSDGDSSTTIHRIRNEALEGTVVLDVNLRSPWYTQHKVLELARGSGGRRGDNTNNKKLALLKLNEDELCILEEWCELEVNEYNDEEALHTSLMTGSALERRMERLGKCLHTQRLCVTRGKDGAALWCDTKNGTDDVCSYHENSGYSSLLNTIDNNGDAIGDSVGAGDAFLAALVCSLLIHHETPERALERACAIGAYVSSCRGATPNHDSAPESLKNLFTFS